MKAADTIWNTLFWTSEFASARRDAATQDGLLVLMFSQPLGNFVLHQVAERTRRQIARASRQRAQERDVLEGTAGSEPSDRSLSGP
jgi:hypothetical protein